MPPPPASRNRPGFSESNPGGHGQHHRIAPRLPHHDPPPPSLVYREAWPRNPRDGFHSDRLRVGWMDHCLVFLGGGTQVRKMSAGHLPRVVYHQVYNVYSDRLPWRPIHTADQSRVDAGATGLVSATLTMSGTVNAGSASHPASLTLGDVPLAPSDIQRPPAQV